MCVCACVCVRASVRASVRVSVSVPVPVCVCVCVLTQQRAVLLAQTFATGYYHVLVDLLPRMILAKELFLDRDETALLIIQSDVGGEMKPYVTQLLALLRVPLNQIWPYEVRADAGGGSGPSHCTFACPTHFLIQT